jgi:peptidylprolyl isomerase
MAEIVKEGSDVLVHYVGTLENGNIFDSSIDKAPLKFKVGEGKVIKKFEDGIKGMKVNEERTIKIKAEDAYGSKQEALLLKVPLQTLSNIEDIKIGKTYQMHAPNGQVVFVKVIEKDEETATLDLNHPLAGEGLTFKAKIVEIK